ncbi:MAG TPA: hypothetical protein VLA89_14040 [Gemmatimonadales bacterium]|nr:hypothetical protein [Gemmatimonadales bacterium]
MAYYVNEVIEASVQILDDSDAALLGLTSNDFDIIRAVKLPDGDTTVAVTVEEIGNGLYSFSFTPTSTGTWALQLTYNDGGPTERNFGGDFLVERRSSASPTAVASGGLTTTLIQLVQDVAAELGDLTKLTATAAGSDVTLKDERRIKQATNAYAGREIYFVSGTADNVGEWRFVTGSDPSASVVNFDPALDAATAAGDVAILINERGRGFSYDEYVDAINRAIRFARNHALIDMLDELDDPWDEEAPEIDIPDAFLYVSSVEFEDDDGLWQEVRRASSATDDGWYLLPGRLLRISGSSSSEADGFSLRLIGQGAPSELSDDDDATTIDSEWLVMQAASYLDRGGIDRSKNRERERTMQYRQNLANGLLPLIVTLPRVNAVRVT